MVPALFPSRRERGGDRCEAENRTEVHQATTGRATDASRPVARSSKPARGPPLSPSIGCLSGSCYGVARCAGAGNHAPSHAVPAIAERAAPTTTGRACAARTWSESSIGQERRVAATATSTAASPAPGPPDASRLRGPRAAPPRSSGSGRCSSRSPDQPSLNDACPSGRPPFFAGAAVAPGYPYPAYAYPAYPSRFPRHRASASAGAASTGTCSSGETRASPGTRSLAAIAGSSRARAATPSAPTEDRLLVTADAASRVRAGCPGPPRFREFALV